MTEERDWRAQRRTGIAAIAAATLLSSALWFAIHAYGPVIAGMDSLGGRMLFALKCLVIAGLFCLVGGVEAVAHQRLQSPAFDPLAGFQDRRLLVNQRYLQNTLEQFVLLALALVGLAAYLTDGETMRAVLATTVVWVVSRFAFWIGYHRSAAMRGIGAPGMMASMIALLYVGWRVGEDVFAGGGWVVLGAFLAFEAVLFWGTRSRD